MSEPTKPAGEIPPALFVDIRGIFDRGWHASRTSEELAHLDSSRAAACSALMVLLPILGSTYLDETYRHALFAWDGGFHKTSKPRPPKTEDFVRDLAYFKALLPILVSGAHHTAEKCEADDVVATGATAWTSQGGHACVVSGDKDLQQLVNRQVTYYCLNRKSILSASHIMDKWNLFHPSHLAVRLAVVGDSQDGIGGVEKWGEKKWGPKIMESAPKNCDLSTLVEHVAAVIPPAQLDNFYRSLEATLLQTDVPGLFTPEPILAVPLDYLDDEGLTPIRRNYAKFIGELKEEENVTSEVDREY